MCVKTKPCFWLFVLLWLFVYHRTCFSIDKISVGQSLNVSQTLVSQKGIFELGFFVPGTSRNIYLGIWHRNFADNKTVWVANRESPSNDPASSKLELLSDGNLVLLKSPTETVWSTALASSMPNTSKAEAVILDDGNFVIRDGSNPSTIYWQSFDYPTDTWLPGAKLGINKHTGQVQRLISWKNSENPAPGMFSTGVDPNGSSQFFIEWNRSHRYWSSGDWNGQIFSLVPEMRFNYVYNYSYVSNENESYFTYSMYNPSFLSRYVIDVSGQTKQFIWTKGPWNWYYFWAEPKDQASVYGLCGVFGVFHNSSSDCECLKGFKQLVQNDRSSGCVRKSPLQCQNKKSIGKEDGFLKMSNLTLPANSKTYQKVSAGRCRLDCMEKCSCMAYTYNNYNGCSFWEGDLIDLQQSGVADGRAGAEVYIRLAASEPRYKSSTDAIMQTSRYFELMVYFPKPGIAGGVVAGISIAAVAGALLSAVFIYVRFYRKKKVNGAILLSSSQELSPRTVQVPGSNSNKTVDATGSQGLTGLTVEFSYEELAKATDDFSLANKIGQGGFGAVYYAELRGEKAAIKKMDMQASKEFFAELKVLTHVHHLNLLRLIGYCVEGSLFLVYEFIENGNLSEHLRGSEKDPLPWSRRVQIALDSARGLEYIHEHTVPVYIHRDIKSANILIDKNFRGKVADFGLTKLTEVGGTSLPTRLVGTFGYMPPEYAQYGDVSPKVDVYALGVVLYELISAKEAIVKTNGSSAESRGLVALFEEVLNQPDPKEDLRKVVDPRLGEDYPLDSVCKMAQLAKACTQENPQLRPSMRSIVVALMTLSSSTEDWDVGSFYDNQPLVNLMSGR
ncbi:hypothetical protein DKX38_007066 [Salix brachista]|uniref:Receptor-like serine/threonine-protein kinase n=1 Tax=Salix brachista TaxID=2182728 RepID=A0A5N5MME2_9ROSI|nr:hypothetical protein DKX38_007066 [Salix brachista]